MLLVAEDTVDNTLPAAHSHQLPNQTRGLHPLSPVKTFAVIAVFQTLVHAEAFPIVFLRSASSLSIEKLNGYSHKGHKTITNTMIMTQWEDIVGITFRSIFLPVSEI